MPSGRNVCAKCSSMWVNQCPREVLIFDALKNMESIGKFEEKYQRKPPVEGLVFAWMIFFEEHSLIYHRHTRPWPVFCKQQQQGNLVKYYWSSQASTLGNISIYSNQNPYQQILITCYINLKLNWVCDRLVAIIFAEMEKPKLGVRSEVHMCRNIIVSKRSCFFCFSWKTEFDVKIHQVTASQTWQKVAHLKDNSYSLKRQLCCVFTTTFIFINRCSERYC